MSPGFVAPRKVIPSLFSVLGEEALQRPRELCVGALRRATSSMSVACMLLCLTHPPTAIVVCLVTYVVLGGRSRYVCLCEYM